MIIEISQSVRSFIENNFWVGRLWKIYRAGVHPPPAPDLLFTNHDCLESSSSEVLMYLFITHFYNSRLEVSLKTRPNNTLFMIYI